MKKLITSMTLILGLSMTMLTNVAADTITFVHGNNGTSKYCYAETKQQKANHTLGAQITWQVSGSNTVYYASRASGTGASVTSKYKNLKGKKGKSFGYYYVDGKLKHESTAWMNFKF